MKLDKALIVFQGKNIRRIWHKEEGFEVYDVVVRLKMPALDGKFRETDCAN